MSRWCGTPFAVTADVRFRQLREADREVDVCARVVDPPLAAAGVAAKAVPKLDPAELKATVEVLGRCEPRVEEAAAVRPELRLDLCRGGESNEAQPNQQDRAANETPMDHAYYLLMGSGVAGLPQPVRRNSGSPNRSRASEAGHRDAETPADQASRCRSASVARRRQVVAACQCVIAYRRALMPNA